MPLVATSMVLALLAMTILAAAPAPAGPSRQEQEPPRLASSSYWGGSGDESGVVASGPDGSVHLAGTTASADLPLRRPLMEKSGRRADAWVTKLSPDGRRVRYSTYLGGRGLDTLADATVDAAGNLVIVGSTNSRDFPLENAADSSLNGSKDAFVVKLSPSGDVVFSTFYGGSEGDHATAVDTDAAGSVYVHGYTFSPDFPTTPGALKTSSPEDSQDATVVKLTPEGDLVYATRLGGETESELGYDVVADAAGSAYLSGWTASTDFPTVDAAQPMHGGSYDAYVAKLDPAGAALDYSTYLGGRGLEGGGFLAETPGGGIAVALGTFSHGLATTGFQEQPGGKFDVYLAVFGPEGSLDATSYLGGSGQDNVFGLDSRGDELWVVGSTGSKDFPLEDPIQPRFGGRSKDDQYLADAFVARVSDDLSALTFSTFLGGSRDDGAFGVSTGSGPVWVTGPTYSRDFPTRRALDRTWNGVSDVWFARIE